MPPSKKLRLYNQVAVSRVAIDTAHEGALEVATNSEKGLLSLPLELQSEILGHYQKVDFLTRTPHDNPVLPEDYLEYTDVLRALSQVSVAYRQSFSPILWETVNVCFSERDGNTTSFFKHVAEALARKCDGLKANPELRPFVKRVNVVLTRYRSNLVLPKFRKMLKSLPNLTTLHVLHTHTQMSSAIQKTFEGIELPSIRTLLIQGYCHHILPSCPNVKTLWCVREDGQKLVSMIEKHCKSLEELRGFHLNEKYMKRLVKAVPNLRVFDVPYGGNQPILSQLCHFRQLSKVIIRADDIPKFNSPSYNLLKKCIQDVKLQLAHLPKRPKIRILYEDVGLWKPADTTRLPTAQYGDISVYESEV